MSHDHKSSNGGLSYIQQKPSYITINYIYGWFIIIFNAISIIKIQCRICIQAWPFDFQKVSGQLLASVGLNEPFFPKQKYAFKTSLNQREEVHWAFKPILWSKKIVALPAPTDNRISYRAKTVVATILYASVLGTSRLLARDHAISTCKMATELILIAHFTPVILVYSTIITHRSRFVSKSTDYPPVIGQKIRYLFAVLNWIFMSLSKTRRLT